MLFIYLCLYVAYTYLLTDSPPLPIPLGSFSFCLTLPCFASLRFRLVSFHLMPSASPATYLRCKGWGVAQPRKAERNSNGNLKFFTIKMLLSCPFPSPFPSCLCASLHSSSCFLHKMKLYCIRFLRPFSLFLSASLALCLLLLLLLYIWTQKMLPQQQEQQRQLQQQQLLLLQFGTDSVLGFAFYASFMPHYFTPPPSFSLSRSHPFFTTHSPLPATLSRSLRTRATQ